MRSGGHFAISLIWGFSLLSPFAWVSSAQIVKTINFYTVPTVVGDGGTSLPNGITAGPDGALWFTEQSGHKVGRITTSGVITEYPITSSGLGGITAGPDGALWFVEQGYIGRISTAGDLSEYLVPGSPWDLAVGPDGALWFPEQTGNKIGRITTAGVINEYPVPTENSLPTGITSGPDGALWFTEPFANQIGRITTAGVVTEYRLPTPGSEPLWITVAPDGALWFTETLANQIGRITIAGVVTEYPVLTHSNPFTGITAGPDGALWFTEESSRIGRITTAGVVTEYLIPIPGSEPFGITTGPDGALWFTDGVANKIGQIVLAQTDLTPPVISPIVNGTLGANGWYVSSVIVTWSINDPESGIASSSGCSTANLAADTVGTVLTCTATNGAGLSSSVSINVKIDRTPPVIAGMPAPDCTIWPPNHKLVQVATVTTTDAVSGLAPGSFAVTGTGSDSANGSIVITAGPKQFNVQLGADKDEIYTLSATASDLAGNIASKRATCSVPHDKGK